MVRFGSSHRSSVASLFLLFSFTATCRAQDASSVARKELASVFHDVDDETLRHSPELATHGSAGKYSDQLDDLSVREFNEHLEHERGFLARLGSIDTAGLGPQDRASVQQLEKKILQEEEQAPSKPWETPLDPVDGFHRRLEKLAAEPCETVQDYDNYVARLKKVPEQFRQVITNMMLGLDEGKVQPASTVREVLTQVQTTAGQRPEESVFAAPLKRFPASIPASTRQRIADDLLSAVQDDVLPAYARFGRFLTAQVLPSAQKQVAQ